MEEFDDLTQFRSFGKIGRLSRDCIITEKIDGTNACICIGDDGSFRTGSRTRWITPEDDNFGFSSWAHAHKDELMGLGPGRHFGEWWGAGIQRKYGIKEKRFSLFNVRRWTAPEALLPSCVSVVPVVASGMFCDATINVAISRLSAEGSLAAPGFMDPEGIVIYHIASGTLFKKTLVGDEKPKGSREE